MQSAPDTESERGQLGTTRRTLLKTLGVAGSVGLGATAGCSSESNTQPTTASTATTNTESTATPQDRTVTDGTDRTVTLPIDVSEIVAVGPGTLNLVSYLDALEMVAGVEQNEHRWGQNNPYNIANPSLQEKPVIGPHRGGDPELIAGVDPDVILANYVTAGNADDLQATVGRPVIVVKDSGHPIHQTEGFYGDLEFVADIIGKTDRARSVIEFVRSEVQTLDELSAGVSDSERPDVFLAGRSDTGGAGVTSTQHPFAPFSFVNAANVADSITGHATVNEEKLLTWDPDVIFIAESNLDRVKDTLSQSTYSGIKAIEEGNLYGLLPSRFYGDLYGSVLANAYSVGTVLYPDAFSAVDPATKADRIYEFMLGARAYDELADRFGGFKRISLG